MSTTGAGEGGGRQQHLSIGEVLALLQADFPDITISKIRFLEHQGLLDPERTPSGYRKFYDDDIARLRWILAQQRDHFLPLKVIKERLADPTFHPGEAAAASTPAAAPATDAGADGGRAPSDRAAFAQALQRRAADRVEARPGAGSAAFRAGGTDVSLTRAELAAAADVAEREIERLESFGLLRGRTIGRETVFDADALAVARVAAAFLAQGLEPRHLRMFKVAADREADLYEQLVTPLLRQRSPDGRARAGARLGELADLGRDLHALLLRQGLGRIAGP